MLTSTTLNTRRKQRGITLIEVSIGLIIAAIVAAAAFLAFQANQRRSEVRENVSNIVATLAEVQQKFGREKGYLNLTNSVALQSGTTTAANSYGGVNCVLGVTAVTETTAAASPTACITTAATATATDAADRENNFAVVSYTQVPEDQCLDIVAGTMAGAARVLVGATLVATNGVFAPAAACAAGPNTINWQVAVR